MNPYILNVFPKRMQQTPIQEETKITPEELMNEISWSESDLLRSFFTYGQNPDPIARQKGLHIYRDMMEDDQIKACVELRKQARLSTPWEILSADETNDQANEMADFIRHVLKRMKGTFEDDLYEIYSAIEYGFSISELVYKILEDGPFAGKIGLEAIKTREPYNYDFKVDEHGNLLGIIYTGIAPSDAHGQRNSNSNVITPNHVTGKILRPGFDVTPTRSGYLGSMENPFPPEKFIIYSYNMQFGNWYGRSDLFSAFRSWLIKKHALKFWSVWLERYATPFIWASVKRDAGLKKGALDEIDNFLRLIGTRNAIRVSDDVTLNPIQFSTAGGDAYEKAIEAHNRFISHAILCPNLIGLTGSQGSGGSGGSYALGKKHFDAFVWVLEKMGRDTSETIVGEQIIKRLIEMNFPEVDTDLIPKFKFEGVEEESIEARSRIVTMLATGGFISPEEEWVRDFLTIPKKDPDIVLPMPVGQVQDGAEDDDELDPRAQENLKSKNKIKKFKSEDREPNFFEKKIRVKDFARKLDSGESVFFKDLTDAMIEIRDAMISQIEKKEIVESGDPKSVEMVKMNVGDLKNVLRMWMVKFHLDAKLQALEELGRAGVEIEVTRNFAAEDAPFEPWKPLPPQEAIDFFNRKVKAKVVDKNGKKVIVELGTRNTIPYYDEKAFVISGIVRDDILSDAKQILLNGIKRQDRVGAISDLKNLFNGYLQQGIEVDEELLKPHRLQTIARTNMVEAINEGRRAMYEDESVKGFVEYWEYTAIMDQRTTDYCRCMDGKIFRMEEMPMLNPPAHYNCRSFSVPVTKFEIEDLKKDGRGIEVSQPCPDRAAAFADVKREPINTLPGTHPVVENVPKNNVPEDMPAAKRNPKDVEATESLRAELAKIVTRCPYQMCLSHKIKMIGKRFNIGDFECEDCTMPFRVSNKGDLYLYDAGMEKWERVSMGLTPHFFKSKE